MLKLKMINFIYFILHLFFILKLRIRISMISYVIIINVTHHDKGITTVI